MTGLASQTADAEGSGPAPSDESAPALDGATSKEQLVGIMYSDESWVVAGWIKAVFFWCMLIFLVGLVAYGVDKRLTMWRLTMDSVVEPQPIRGVMAPDFTLPEGVTNKSVKLSDYRGQWVFLNFWATWCPPCRDEMPSMEMLKRRLGDRIQMLAVSVDEDYREVNKFFGDTPPSFQVLWDRRKTAAARYGTRKFPETYLINPEGKVVVKFTGPRDWYNVGTVQYFEDILSGKRIPNA